MNKYEFMQKMSLPYEAKIAHALIKAREFYDRTGGNVIVSVGGLDSITLLTFLRETVSKDIPAASVSCLEDKSITAIHRRFDNFTFLQPLKNKAQVIREHGYPVLSKEKASKIHMLQNPTPDNATVRHAIMTGETGEYGGYRTKETGSRMRLPQKWLNLFGGPENERYGTHYQTAAFKVSSECCYYMKEKPCDIHMKKTGRYPYLGLMASEGGQRRFALFRNGCNLYGKTVTRSAPFAIFDRQDLLRLAIDLNVPVPAIYGTIERKSDGTLYTTRAQRTGCEMCGFGIHFEPRPHRFDRLREDNPRAWHFWMYDMGWGRVLDYIGVKWEDEPVIWQPLSLDFGEAG